MAVALLKWLVAHLSLASAALVGAGQQILQYGSNNSSSSGRNLQ